MSGTTLVTKYRPISFEEVIGHGDILSALRRALSGDSHPHCFLFSGPGGLGKTTLARIVGSHFDCDILEIDAASNSGVDATRELVEIGNHMSLAGEGRRMILIDECHTLSKQAWQPLLKLTEEPPAHLFFALCTTELHKVPDTIQQRFYKVALRPVSGRDMDALLADIAELEGWDVLDEVRQAVVEASQGSPRKGISILQQVYGCRSRDEVKRIVQLIDESDPVIRICQAIVQRKGWSDIQPHLSKLEDDTLSAAVPVISAYMCKCMIGAKDSKQAQRYWTMIEALTFPTASYDTKATLLAAIGKMLWS